MLGYFTVTRYGQLVHVPYDPIQQSQFAATAGNKTGMEAGWEKLALNITNTAGEYKR